MNNVNKIVASQLCYGCGACSIICGLHAIDMQYDNIGRLLPIIDKSKCINCGLCYDHCPGLDLKGIQLPDIEDKYTGYVEKVYIGKATDERIYRNSQSGGLVTATLKFLFDAGKIDAAIVCRVENAVEYTPKAVVINSRDNLYLCQKSSYVPIDIVSAMKHTDSFQSIAVVGTGCHIQGIRALQNFNKKYKEKVKYTLGLICDRTLCKTVTDVIYGDCFKDISKKIIWRDKSLDYRNARVLIKTTDNRIAQVPTWKRHKLKDPFTNPRCRICFDKLNTGADIVFGDPWGMKNVDWKGGMSVVLTRSKKGSDIISDMINSHKVEMQAAPLEEVIIGQHIENKKKQVAAALTYFQKKSWLTPCYAKYLSSSIEDPQLNSLINKFIDDSSKMKDEIVKQNIKYLRSLTINSSIHKIINFPIRIIRKISN